ncbi:D-2-hydroxyacid dehydrogenase [Halobacillus campisalis]|uniref:D-2-hydroxyacid dehydrogenase n=1 Tax=Halobacillus campisalis TaxID=435909 RepID=A0ABW2K2A0_9BACI|nr:D-2-hydroxyacid dehydrogenase [Halobacillus campisalis]
MIVLSAIKRVPESIKKHIQHTFKEADFLWCHGIEEAEQHLNKAEIFITYGEDLNDALIDKAKHLKWIMVLSAGMDRMPFEAIGERDILVTNVRGIHAQPMAEYALSMILQVARNAKVLYQREKEHAWDRSVPMAELSGSNMVLLGTGAIAQETARLAKAFNMKTIGVSRSGKSKSYFDETCTVEEMHTVLPEADYVVAALPSTPETSYLLTKDHFALMPARSVFLNMGRGDLVESSVILEAVQQEEISHAVLDVFEQEPLPKDHPFWKEEKVTITSHLSGISPQYVPRAFEVFERNMNAYLNNGEMENIIDTKRGY